jgi:putative Mn2+ efflux pump MntP
MPEISFLLLGTDSLIAGAALGPLLTAHRGRWLAALFGVADAAGFATGWLLDWHLSDELTGYLRSLLVFSYGVYVLLAVSTARRSVARWPMWLMPWVLCIDNLGYGLGSRSSGSAMLQHAGVQAVSSGLLALVGLALGVATRRVAPRAATRIAGGGLIAGSAVLLLI